MKEFVILVDENDNEIGIEEKMKAHEDARLHRAFSIFIFNSNGEMLLQQRACDKYHSGCLWTNACCSHPRPGETVEQAAHRRLMEELGFDTDMRKAFHFIYKAEFDHGLTEHEFDHVFIGQYDGSINSNPDEVEDFKWIDLETLHKEMKENPDDYTVWFKIALDKFLNMSGAQCVARNVQRSVRYESGKSFFCTETKFKINHITETTFLEDIT